MLKCVCGSQKFKEFTRPAYDVDEAGVTKLAENAPLILGECLRCGIIRQIDVPFSNYEQYEEYYRNYPPTKKSYGTKNYEHDRSLAVTRCKEYGIRPGYGGRILDVGSGSGVLVEEARARGAEAYGCEIAKYHYASQEEDEWVYRQRFEDVNFPTDYFHKVTCHDVLEHVLEPKIFIEELFRVTKQNGECFVDFPNYFHDSGKHHWKRHEHVWLFTPDQLKELFKTAGFKVIGISKPIESKVLFKLQKPTQIRPSILVPPGIGDSYWSIVKLQSFLKREGLSLPNVSVVCPRTKGHDGHKRSFPFLQMFPFLNCTFVAIEGKQPGGNPIWKEAYMRAGRTIFKNVLGFDYFIAYNGHLRVGTKLEEVDPDLECNWIPPMFISLEQEYYRREAIQKYGNYILFYFVFQGTYKYWTDQFPISNVIDLINGLTQKTGMKPVFVGASWDAEERNLFKVKAGVHGHVDLVGKTSVEQLFGLIRGAQAVVGYPSGLTIMSTVLKQKTIIIWNDYYNRDFVRNACPPMTWEKTYWAENTYNLTPDYLTDWVLEKITGKQLPNRVKRKPLDDQTTVADLSGGAQANQLMAPKSTIDTDILIETIHIEKQPKPLITIACVLKSGGDYTERYVANLQHMLERNLTKPFEFICLTDVNMNGCRTVKLEANLDGWWSKVELFRPGIFTTERIVYFDLDTIILKNIDDIFDLDDQFYALRPWNRANQQKGHAASGIMAWENGLEFIFSEFAKNLTKHLPGDQAYFSRKLTERQIVYRPLQDIVPGIYSYKRQCRNGLPEDARIVCFHGRPRIHELSEPWIREHWR